MLCIVVVFGILVLIFDCLIFVFSGFYNFGLVDELKVFYVSKNLEKNLLLIIMVNLVGKVFFVNFVCLEWLKIKECREINELFLKNNGLVVVNKNFW